MPSLAKIERESLLGPIPTKCGACGWQIVRNYCRSCDVFVMSCKCEYDNREHDTKDGHRMYIWTFLGVIAIPDFDFNGSR